MANNSDRLTKKDHDKRKNPRAREEWMLKKKIGRVGQKFDVDSNTWVPKDFVSTKAAA